MTDLVKKRAELEQLSKEALARKALGSKKEIILYLHLTTEDLDHALLNGISADDFKRDLIDQIMSRYEEPSDDWHDPKKAMFPT